MRMHIPGSSAPVKESVRTHILLPPEVVAEVDRLVGPRRRSEFILDATAEKLARLRLAKIAAKAAGSLAEVDIPGWESSASASRWVQQLRRQAD